jgi:hypothetical protein|tara:strand:- start:1328 stop:1930 length:603 start_codon:yes stop_codon:yes gene_type:complete
MFHLKQEGLFFTSAEINLIIGVDAFTRIAEDIDYPKTNYSTYVNSGVWQVSTPSDFLKVDENSCITYEDDSTIHELGPARLTSIGRNVVLNATPGTPANYFMEKEDMVGLYPPGTSGCLVIPYVQEPTSLSSDSDTNQITRQTYMAAVYWTVHEAMLKDNDGRADKYLALYQNEIARNKKRFGEMYELDYAITPHEDYLE